MVLDADQTTGMYSSFIGDRRQTTCGSPTVSGVRLVVNPCLRAEGVAGRRNSTSGTVTSFHLLYIARIVVRKVSLVDDRGSYLSWSPAKDREHVP